MSSFFSNLFKYFYASYRQYLYTTWALTDLVWKRIVHGEDYFREHVYIEPECVRDGWNHCHVQLKSGIRIHYVDEGPNDAPETILMVHGFPEFWYSWRYQLEHFKKTNRRCIAIDMRGYNQSDKPNGTSNYSLDILVEDIRDFIESLNLKNVILTAHDWGAIVCWRAAILHPEIIQKLIIFDVPHPFAFYEIFKESQEQRDKSWYIYLFQSPRIPEIMLTANKLEWIEKMFRGKRAGIRNRKNFNDNDMQAWKHVFSQPGGITGPVNYYREIFNAKPIPVGKAKVKPPVLIIWGEEDAFLDKRGAYESVKYCNSCAVHMIPGASHWVQQDEPEMVNEIMERFIEDPQSSLTLSNSSNSSSKL